MDWEDLPNRGSYTDECIRTLRWEDEDGLHRVPVDWYSRAFRHPAHKLVVGKCVVSPYFEEMEDPPKDMARSLAWKKAWHGGCRCPIVQANFGRSRKYPTCKHLDVHWDVVDGYRVPI